MTLFMYDYGFSTVIKIHRLLLFSGVPTIFVAYTDPKAKLSIDWSGVVSGDPKLAAKSISFKGGNVMDTFTVLFTKV